MNPTRCKAVAIGVPDRRVTAHHVQLYAIEVFKEGKWSAVARGQAIGHKKIDQFAPVQASRVRLHILSSSGQAHIPEFQLFLSEN